MLLFSSSSWLRSLARSCVFYPEQTRSQFIGEFCTRFLCALSFSFVRWIMNYLVATPIYRWMDDVTCSGTILSRSFRSFNGNLFSVRAFLSHSGNASAAYPKCKRKFDWRAALFELCSPNNHFTLAVEHDGGVDCSKLCVCVN